jgi:hypothetical protein
MSCAKASTVYYVSTNGSNTNPGTQAAPFKTIQHAANVARGGDTVIVKGGVYFERIIDFTNRGTASSPVVFRAASGEKVVIDHGLKVPSWSLDGGSVYKGIPIFPNPNYDKPYNTTRVVVDNKPLIKVGTRSQMVEGTFWVDTSGTIYAWAFGGVNPGTKETLVINLSSNYHPGIQIFNDSNSTSVGQYITLDGFIHRAGEFAIWAADWSNTNSQEGLTVKNCEIKFAWQSALFFKNWNGGVMDNCNVHNNGQINIPRRNSVVWPHAINGENGDNIKILNSRIHNNHGEGVGPYLGSSNWEISKNIVYDNWSVNIYVDTDEGNILVDGNFVYNTGKYTGQARDYSDGIRIANEQADLNGGDPTPGVYNINVTNNVVTNTTVGVRFFNYGGNSFLQNSTIANNTIGPTYNNTDAIYVRRGDNVKIKNNLAYPNKIVLDTGLGATGIVAEKNLVKDQQTGYVLWGTGVKVINSVYGNPLYRVGSGYIASNYKVLSSSPALNTGITVDVVKKDFQGIIRPQASHYDIGAYEGL